MSVNLEIPLTFWQVRHQRFSVSYIRSSLTLKVTTLEADLHQTVHVSWLPSEFPAGCSCTFKIHLYPALNYPKYSSFFYQILQLLLGGLFFLFTSIFCGCFLCNNTLMCCVSSQDDYFKSWVPARSPDQGKSFQMEFSPHVFHRLR